MSEERELVCCRCKIPLRAVKNTFTYIGQHFSADVPACPLCGQVYISEELVNGRIRTVETQMEDK